MKRVLDMCCGPRCFYFDKADTRVLACDVRTANFTNQLNRTCIVAPDLLQDFRHLPEEWSGRFDLVLATRFPTKSGTHWIVFYKEEA